MRKFYELTIDGDDLKVASCEVIDVYADDVTDGFKADLFHGRKIAQFFKRLSDGSYDIAWCQNLCEYKGKVILPLCEQECLTSDSPIDKFSWEDDVDVDAPNHKIILEG